MGPGGEGGRRRAMFKRKIEEFSENKYNAAVRPVMCWGVATAFIALRQYCSLKYILAIVFERTLTFCECNNCYDRAALRTLGKLECIG